MYRRFVRVLGRPLNHHAKVVKRFSIRRKRADHQGGVSGGGWLRWLRLQEGPQVLWIQWFPQRVLHSARRVRCRVWAPVLVGEKGGCFPQGRGDQRTAKGLPSPFLRSPNRRATIATHWMQVLVGFVKLWVEPVLERVDSLPTTVRRSNSTVPWSIQQEGRWQGAVGLCLRVERPCPAHGWSGTRNR